LITDELICEQLNVKRASTEKGFTYLTVVSKLHRKNIFISGLKQCKEILGIEVLVEKEDLKDNGEKSISMSIRVRLNTKVCRS